MGKMFNALLLVIAIEIAFSLFPVPETTTTSLLDFLQNPSLWSTSGWFTFITSSIVGLGAAAIFIGSFITGRDWVWRTTIIATYITFGAVIMQMWVFLNAHLLYLNVMAARRLITTIIVAPFLLYFISVCLDFISGKD